MERVMSKKDIIEETIKILGALELPMYLVTQINAIHGSLRNLKIVTQMMEAEEKAAAMKAEAIQRAAEIVAAAESKATETEKNAVAVCKAYKTTQTKVAIEEANAQYTAEIANTPSNRSGLRKNKFAACIPPMEQPKGRMSCRPV